MHKDFYASGFLYHPRSQQILLQQSTDPSDQQKWTLFEGKRLLDESSEIAFKRIALEVLNIRLSLSSVHPVYEYFHSQKGRNQSITYGEVKTQKKFTVSKGRLFGWFTFRQIARLGLSEQTKQDLTVGQRVIDSALRKSLGQRTIG
ncbi:MAG: hypothetical protein ACD_37C00049G0002 [uncultured bacterium]|nr:MAG: hypothetical protein ACD_37C00049G0002 [uncultured bacterium]KKR17582.1 MAG: hypothetical protein UT44_C0006G0009 [Candidatus Levybacteria bacterium GW2011_GWA1_39_32]KKR73567.1 MAG: hypothetical protein UU15_C0007G0013 [Candidatus Levybacteria bacterium GW2011_GWC2_40_7]OGH20316.1 MAG: hypothetical protein A2695_02540 [Candidatus Levybacteria bacterium RIFCSPHIGHO2_01_FULL_40_83]OGH24624.1 MAG: hypothetical protein A3D82_01100 [Candidatus Levybacteria bacterium RIFCSPHIGHO2_02_FULL_40_